MFAFESDVPVPYSGRPPHIHIRSTAQGFKTLVTQHYPEPGKTKAVFDIVLVPSKAAYSILRYYKDGSRFVQVGYG